MSEFVGVSRVVGTLPRSIASGCSDYAVLSRRIRAAGLLRRRRARYAFRIALTVAFLGITWASVIWVGNSWYQVIVAAVLGIAFTQIAFLGHDGGHHQVFAHRRLNDIFGQTMGSLTGLSYGWWVGKHNRHHSHPNTEGHDPDIGDGVLAFTTEQAAKRTGRLGRFIVRRQAWLFFPLLLVEGLNLHFSSVRALLPGADRSDRGGGRHIEMVVLGSHLIAYLTVLFLVMSPVTALVFVAVHQAVWGFYMGCSFAPNHKGMPIIADDAKVDYLRRQVLTSRNVRGGVFTDLLLGGLNYQIEHHLFPSMPRSSLPRARGMVRDYCAELEIPYTETSLGGSYVAALRYLNALGAPLRTRAVVRPQPELTG